MANFVNDVARSNKLVRSVLEDERAGFDGHGRMPASLLAGAYLRSGADRQAFQSALALTACKFQDDPHNQKITHSAFEEYAVNSTHLRDRLLLAATRLLAGWPKMPGERECYARFIEEWIKN
jgi:hypothetical protein